MKATHKTGAARRMSPILGLLALPLIALTGCGPATQVAEAPIANIPAPLPANIPLIETPPPAPVLIGQHKGEDLWHLRSGLNVAALLCQGPDNAALVAKYNKMLTAHKGLLAEAAQIEVDLFRSKGGRKWQDAYDDHMTKVYNSYSGTLTRDAFCSSSKAILAEAQDAAPVTLSEKATLLLWQLNKAAGLPDPDGQLARSNAHPGATQTVQATNTGSTGLR